MSGRRLYLLKLEPQNEPVFFVVEHVPMDDDAAEYVFAERSCPTNYIQCEGIISEGDIDPHGLFEFVRSADRPQELDEAHYPEKVWRMVFPEAFRARRRAISV